MADGSRARVERAWIARGFARRDFLRLVSRGVSLATLGGIVAACSGGAPATVAPAAPSPTTPPSAPSRSPATTVSGLPPRATPSAAAGVSPTRAASATPGSAAHYPGGGRYSTMEPIGRVGGGVVEVYFSDATTNNPLLTADTASNARIALQYLSLLGLDPDTALPYPELAAAVPTRENGGISQDGLTYTFVLRRDVLWSDGAPFTARDVVFTYGALARKELGSPRTAQVTERIARVSSPDDYTVVFALTRVVASFLITNCTGAGFGIAPAHILGAVPTEQVKAHPFSQGDPRLSVATGPFLFREWTRGASATFVRNSRFFRGAPALDRYTFRVVANAAAVAEALRAGEADWGLVPLNRYGEFSRLATVQTTQHESYGFEYAAFQLDPARTTLFGERAVRRALAHALDREDLARSLYSGLATVARGTLPPPSFAYAPDRVKAGYPYDPGRAEALLEEAGWRKGPDGIRAKENQRLQFTIWTNSGNAIREGIAKAMQTSWRAIGVEATPRTEEWTAFLARLNETRDFEVAVLGFTWDADPDQSAMWSSKSFPPHGFNLGQYANPEADTLIERGLAETDPARRAAIAVELQDFLLDDLPAIILVFPRVVAAVNRRLHNCFPNAVGAGPRWNAHRWWVEDGR